jgi:hypothetical protein
MATPVTALIDPDALEQARRTSELGNASGFTAEALRILLAGITVQD